MSPLATQRLRRVTALAEVLWAFAALLLAIWGQVGSAHTLEPPIRTSHLGGLVLVSAVTEEGRAAGVERGNRVLSVDGVPIRDWYRTRGSTSRFRAPYPRAELRSVSELESA